MVIVVGNLRDCMTRIGIVWDRKNGERLGCFMQDGYAGPIEFSASMFPVIASKIPSQMIPDEMEYQCHQRLMAAGCLFEELSSQEKEGR